LIWFLLSTIYCSCAVPRVDLTKEEKELENKLKVQFQCDEIELRHDYQAITKNKTNGKFTIALCDNFCKMDSLKLSKEILNLAKLIKPVLTHESNYSTIWFFTSIEKHIDEKTSKLACSKTI
jgi:hypothetical protein